MHKAELTHTFASYTIYVHCILEFIMAAEHANRGFRISSSGLLVKGAPSNFISPDTKERPVNAALVQVIQITYWGCQENSGGL